VEVVVEVKAGAGVDDAGSWIMDKVLGDDGLIGVSENALERTVGSLLQDGLDVVAGARLLGAEGQVDHGNVWCWDLLFVGGSSGVVVKKTRTIQMN